MEKITYKLEADLLHKAVPYLERNCQIGSHFFIEWDYAKPRKFPCKYEDFMACFSTEKLDKKFEYIDLSLHYLYKEMDYIKSIADNEGLVYAIWLLLSVIVDDMWDTYPDNVAEVIDPMAYGPKDDYESAVAFLLRYAPYQWKTFYSKLSKDELVAEYKIAYQEWQNDYFSNEYSQAVEGFYKSKTRRDTLELFKYAEQKIKTEKDSANEPTTITIKYGKGKKVVLNNIDNWFEKVVLGNHFAKYLKDIKSLEEAENALKQEKYKGRTAFNSRLDHFIFGTYKMICDHFQTETVTESFCRLMRTLLKVALPHTNTYDGMEVEKNIRKCISKLKKTPEKYLWNLSMVKHAFDKNDIDNTTRTSLYVRMIYSREILDQAPHLLW